MDNGVCFLDVNYSFSCSITGPMGAQEEDWGLGRENQNSGRTLMAALLSLG